MLFNSKDIAEVTRSFEEKSAFDSVASSEVHTSVSPGSRANPTLSQVQVGEDESSGEPPPPAEIRRMHIEDEHTALK